MGRSLGEGDLRHAARLRERRQRGRPAAQAARSGVPAAASVERARHDPARQLDLEGVVAGRRGVARAPPRPRARKAARSGRCARQHRLRRAGAPGLRGDAAERDPRLRDRAAVEPQGRGGRHDGEGVGGALADLEVAGMRREGCRRSAGRRTATISSPGSSTRLALGRVAGQAVEAPRAESRGGPRVPSISTTASSATSGTQKSDGWVAMQLSLQPSTACSRFSPPRASQPAPGSRLLQALATS